MRRAPLTPGAIFAHSCAAVALAITVSSSGCGADKIAGGDADGARIFAEACARCHGSTGTPPPNMASQYGVPDLRRPEFHRDNDLAAVRKRIAQGSNRKGMPAFGTALLAEQLDAVAAYVKGFAGE